MRVRTVICVIALIIMPCIGVASTHTAICTLGDHEYNTGDMWHPKLIPYGENTCINCTCLHGGDVQCVGVDCPKPDCADPIVIPGVCCPTCNAKRQDDRDHLKQLPGCTFHGAHYQDGEVFPSSKTALKPKYDNQCVLCTCYRGEVICHLKTCLQSPGCQRVITVDDDCCPRCEEEAKSDQFNFFSTESKNHTLKDGDCLSATGRQKNGSTWKPVIGPYGAMECIVPWQQDLNDTGEEPEKDGQVNCGRLKCPDEVTLKCKKPELGPGGCCKKCPNSRAKKRKKKKKRNKCKRFSDAKKKLQCRRRHKDSRGQRKRGRVKEGVPLFQDDMPLSELIDQICMPHKTQSLVYHTRGDNFESLAFDGPKDKMIEQLYWTVDQGRLQATQRKLILDPVAYRKNITAANLIGATKKKNMRRFISRLDRRQQKCKEKCKRKLLIRSIRKLQLKDVTFNKSCQ